MDSSTHSAISKDPAASPTAAAAHAANIPISRHFRIANFDTFGGKARLPNQSSTVRVSMPNNRPNISVPETVKDQKPVDDFFATRLADRIRMEAWRKKLTIIRGEILELAEQGSQQGLVELKRETVELARTLKRLEMLLGLADE